jgi:hypothetical protein
MGSDLHLHPPSRNRIIKFIHVTCCRWHSLLQRAGGCYEMLLPERTSLHLSQDKRKLICKLQAPNAQRRLCRGGGRQSSSQRRRMSLVVSSTAARVDVTGFKGTTLVDQNRPPVLLKPPSGEESRHVGMGTGLPLERCILEQTRGYSGTTSCVMAPSQATSCVYKVEKRRHLFGRDQGTFAREGACVSVYRSWGGGFKTTGLSNSSCRNLAKRTGSYFSPSIHPLAFLQRMVCHPV